MISFLRRNLSIVLVILASIGAISQSAQACVFLLPGSNPYVPEGHVGYVFHKPWLMFWAKGGYEGILKGPSRWGCSLRHLRVIPIDVRPQTKSEQFEIMVKDDLMIGINAHVILNPDPEKIREVVEQYGAENWYERVVQEPLRTLVRDAVQAHDSRTVKDSRREIEAQIKQDLQKYFEDKPFFVQSVNLGDLHYPEVVTKAVEQKLATQQSLEKKDAEMAIAKKEAEIRVTEARGISEANAIINKSLSNQYIQYEHVKALQEVAKSPNTTIVYVPVGPNGIPVVTSPDDLIKVEKDKR